MDGWMGGWIGGLPAWSAGEVFLCEWGTCPLCWKIASLGSYIPAFWGCETFVWGTSLFFTVSRQDKTVLHSNCNFALSLQRLGLIMSQSIRTERIICILWSVIAYCCYMIESAKNNLLIIYCSTQFFFQMLNKVR